MWPFDTESEHLPPLRARVASAGVDFDDLLRAAGISDPGDAAPKFSATDHYRLWAALDRVAPDVPAGLRLAHAITPGALDMVGYIICNSRTVGEAADRAMRYSLLMFEGLRVQTAAEAGLVHLRIELPSEARHLRHLAEFVLATPVVLGRQVASQPLPIVSARITHAGSRDTSSLAAFLGCPVEYGARCNELTVPGEHLNVPIRNADVQLRGFLEEHAARLLERLPSGASFVERTRQAIESELPDGNPHAVQVAARLGMSERTLRRRLQQEGVAYQEVLDRLRQELAERYLVREKLSATDTAFLLGFSDLSGFNKAYKRWNRKRPDNR